MRTSSASLTLAAFVLIACSGKDGKTELPKDTALARELAEVADTSSYGDAADVAMLELPDSVLARPARRPPVTMRVPPERRDPPAPASDVPPRMSPPSRANDATPSIPIGEAPLPACESPASADQRRCLLRYLSRSDEGLDRTYQSLIGELRRRANTGEREPASVQQLRVAQRAWLVYRDTECRRRNRGQEGPLWAPTRARCLGEFSKQREEELAAQLTSLRAG